MIGAFGGALALAVAVLAGHGTGPDGIGQGVRITARWSFLFFWLSYTGGAHGHPVRPGLCRAGALGASLGPGVCRRASGPYRISRLAGRRHRSDSLQGGLLWFFLVALFFAYLLVLLSFGIGMRNLGRLWRPLLFLATTYILIAFGRDFVPGALDQKTQHWLSSAEYVPFALLSLIAIPLRLAAFLRQRFELSPVSTKPAKRTLVDR